jgi:hypothetical protein
VQRQVHLRCVALGDDDERAVEGGADVRACRQAGADGHATLNKRLVPPRGGGGGSAVAVAAAAVAMVVVVVAVAVVRPQEQRHLVVHTD